MANLSRLVEAIEDYDRAIAIREELVEQEGRRELRNDLASSYNNRGGALANLGRVEDAIEDYDRAIAIYLELVEQEGRRELAPGLESSLFNRALARVEQGKWEEARADLERGGELLRGLITDGQRHLLPSFLKSAGLRCLMLDELGAPERAAAWANDGLRWLLEAVDDDAVTTVLTQVVPKFLDRVTQQREALTQAGLDGTLLDRACEAFPGQ